MNFAIKNIKEYQLEKILSLNQSHLPAVSDLDHAGINNFLKEADYFKCIERNKEILAFLIALGPGKNYKSPNYKWFEDRYDSFVYVDRIIVGEEFQKLGYGKALYRDLVQYSKNKSDSITCEVNIRPKNDGSMLFHKKFGFIEVGTQKTDGGKKEVSLMRYLIP